MRWRAQSYAISMVLKNGECLNHPLTAARLLFSYYRVIQPVVGQTGVAFYAGIR